MQCAAQDGDDDKDEEDEEEDDDKEGDEDDGPTPLHWSSRTAARPSPALSAKPAR